MTQGAQQALTGQLGIGSILGGLCPGEAAEHQVGEGQLQVVGGRQKVRPGLGTAGHQHLPDCVAHGHLHILPHQPHLVLVGDGDQGQAGGEHILQDEEGAQLVPLVQGSNVVQHGDCVVVRSALGFGLQMQLVGEHEVLLDPVKSVLTGMVTELPQLLQTFWVVWFDISSETVKK